MPFRCEWFFIWIDNPFTRVRYNPPQMSNKLENRVKAVIARHFNLPPSKVGLDAAFVGDLGGDPLDLIELGYQLEAAFNFSIPLAPRDTFTTPHDVVSFLRSRQANSRRLSLKHIAI